MSHYQGPTRPHTPIKVVEPGTPEHDAWRRQQQNKQAAYEARFAVTAHLRPEHWGKESVKAKVDRLIEALLEGPQDRETLKRRAGLQTDHSFYQRVFEIGSVKKFRAPFGDKRIVFYWLDKAPASRRRVQTTGYMDDILRLRSEGVPLKLIARQLNLPVSYKSLESALLRHKRKIASAS